MKSCLRVCLAALCLAFPLLSVAQSAASPDDRFLAARDAARAGDRVRLDRLSGELQGYELVSYVEYWRLMPDLATLDPATVRAFLQRHERTYIAEKLRNDWIKQLGKKQQWSEIDAEYPLVVQPEPEVTCYSLQARRARGDASVVNDALPLWLSLVEPPEGCYPVLEALIVDKRVLADEVWARIRRQIEANRPAAARFSMNYLPPSQTPDAKTAQGVTESSMAWLAKLPANFAQSRMQRELAAIAVARVARSDPRMAAEQMARLEGKLNASERGWAWSVIGWQAAQRHMSEALEWYRQAGDVPLSDEVSQWKVRAALRAHDWGAVRGTIERMPPTLASQPTWVYWLGRAYRAGGRLDEANALFSRIAGQPNFYGNLADEELGRGIGTPPRAQQPTHDELAQMAARPDIRRSLTLLRLSMRVEGVREWNWAMRGLNDRELLAAATVAERAGNFDRAIAAADRTKEEHDYSLRYLTPYSQEVRPAAQRQSLDDAWVYGLMRQESRFVTNAKSSAGASGLMQLMPATAKWVANKIGLKDYHQGRVNDTETNLLLGTTYMRMVMESLDNHPVLASAAYNAGPGRARKWRAERPLEGAIYAETIPFTETRDYVKKVMSNAVYYSALFEGQPQSIKNRLGTIAPRAGGDVKVEELP